MRWAMSLDRLLRSAAAPKRVLYPAARPDQGGVEAKNCASAVRAAAKSMPSWLCAGFLRM